MALCLATSLVERSGFDAADQMQRYTRWMTEGYLSSTGKCFDIGTTVRTALTRFQQTGEPLSGPSDPRSAGNGCIMRLAPVPMFFFPDRDAAVHHAGESARTTHGAVECVEASRLFGGMLVQALAGAGKDAILLTHGVSGLTSEAVQSIARGKYGEKSAQQIRGTGYVVESLEAALWCFQRSDSFEDAILCAANLGDDADTTAAICGQVAGAYYGESGIPERWLNRLVMRAEIG